MLPAHSSPAHPDARPLRVFLVDDVPTVRQELRQLLELAGGMRVVGEAGDGLEAVRLAAGIAPDVIVMDMEMPVLDGLEATRRIKACRPAPRVVILSVHAGRAAEEAARAAGADGFVVKGSDYLILVNAIRGMDGPNQPIEKGEKS